MRNLLLSALSLSVLSAAAVTIDVARLPAPSFPDGEVSSDVILPANRLDSLRTFRLEMTFDSTPSNNVEVAFGRDNLPADGFLAAEETDLAAGWDCSGWFVQGPKDRYEFSPAVTGGTRTLTMEIPVSSLDAPKSVTFKDGASVFAFSGLVLDPVPVWFKPDLWTCLRVTVRGYTGTNETVRARFLPDGARILVR